MDAPPPAARNRLAASLAVPLAVVLIVFGVARAWSARIAPGDAPDEPDHLATQAFVARTGRLPFLGEAGFDITLMDSVTKQRIVPRIDPATGEAAWVVPTGHYFELRQPYLFSPQLAHLLGGTIARALGGFSVARARAASALWVALAAGLTFAAVRRLRGRSDLALVAGLGVGLWPQATFVGAYANDDALAILAGSALLYALVAIEKDGTTARRAALLGVALGLTALSKYTAYAAFPLALLWGIRQARREGPRFVRGAAAGTGIGVLLSGWWFVRNALLYDGDVLGLRFAGRRVAEFAASLPDGLAARTRLLAAGSLRARGAPPASVLDHDWLGLTFGSFFGRFGWMSRPLPAAVYVLAAALFVLAAAGVPRRRARDEDAEPSLAVTLLGPAFLFLLLLTSLANSYLVDWQPQGRYLLPCLPGLWAFMVDAAVRQAPPVGKIFPWLLLALVAAANLLAWGFFLRPG